MSAPHQYPLAIPRHQAPDTPRPDPRLTALVEAIADTLREIDPALREQRRAEVLRQCDDIRATETTS